MPSVVSAVLFAVTCTHVMKPTLTSSLKWTPYSLPYDKWHFSATQTSKPNMPQMPPSPPEALQLKTIEELSRIANLRKLFEARQDLRDYYAFLQGGGNHTDLSEAEDFGLPPPMKRKEEFSPGKYAHNSGGRSSLFRRSALDKNFIRFGRSGYKNAIADEMHKEPNNDGTEVGAASLDEPLVFNRPQRSLTSNFLRFGRSFYPDFFDPERKVAGKFLRQGRSLTSNFLRFGRDSST